MSKPSSPNPRGPRGQRSNQGQQAAGKPPRGQRSQAKTQQGQTKQRREQASGQTSRRNAKGHERNRKAVKDRTFSQQAPSQRSRSADPARALAFQVLQTVEKDQAYANLVLPPAIRAARLDARDAAFATELTYGTLRRQGTYDAVLAHCTDRPLDKIGSDILLILRLGTHQLLGMRVPAHAALNQSVALTRAQIGSGPANFVNAVLRRVSGKTPDQWQQILEEEAPDETSRLAISQSHPAWMVRALRQALAAHGRSPEEISQLLEADNQAPAVNLVALPGLGSLAEAEAAGAQPGPLVEDSALYSSGDLARLESVRAGSVRAQDVGSQLVARALAAAPLEGSDQNWLDLCAGPGGKAALLAALAQQRGAHLLANEVAPHRARLVEKSLAPLDSETYAVISADGRQIASSLAQEEKLPGQMGPGTLFDRVMLDVPCSGLGALRRRPEARWRKSPRDIAELLPLQLALFQAALEVTRPGGLLAYVTCSPHMAETQGIVADILRTCPVTLLDSASALEAVARQDAEGQSMLTGDLAVGFQPAELGQKALGKLSESASTAQLWPHVHGTDAMFLALFQKQG